VLQIRASVRTTLRVSASRSSCRVDAVDHGADEILARHGVEHLRRGRPEHRPVGEQHHRQEHGEIRILVRRPRLHLPALEGAAQPVAVLEVEARREAPRPHLRRHDDGQLDPTPPPLRRAPARDRQEPLDHAPLLVQRRRPRRYGEQVEVALRAQAAEDGGAEQVDTENVWPEHLAHELDDALELTRVLPAEHASVSRR
jgi:hypothetical protein